MMQTGDLDRFDAFWEHDLERCQRIGAPWISNTYNNMGQGLFWRGRWPEALERWREAVRLEPAGVLAGFDWVGLLLVTAYKGDKAGTLALLDGRRDSLARLGQPNTLGAWCAVLSAVEALVLAGEPDEAASLYPVVLESIKTGVVVRGADSRLLQCVAGIAAGAGRRWKKAEEHFEVALRQAHDIPVVIEQPEVRRWYARMLVERDEPDDRRKARELLGEAVAMYRKIGMPKHVEIAQAMLRDL
jgi:tetratricopeptide (TPR) repeat protein